MLEGTALGEGRFKIGELIAGESLWGIYSGTKVGEEASPVTIAVSPEQNVEVVRGRYEWEAHGVSSVLEIGTAPVQRGTRFSFLIEDRTGPSLAGFGGLSSGERLEVGGAHPYPTASRLELLYALARGRARLDAVPDHLRPVLAEALNQDPGARPTAEAFRRRLAGELDASDFV